MKRRKKVILIIIAVWLLFIITDLTLAKANKPPLFAVPLIVYKDGGSAEYYGLGYKVIKYVDLDAEQGAQVRKVEWGTWNMKFDRPEAK